MGFFVKKRELLKQHSFSKIETLKTLKTTAQYLFVLAFLLCSSMSCITGYRNNYAKKVYYTQSILDSKRSLYRPCYYSSRGLNIIVLNLYGVNTTNLAWIDSYLNDQEKYIRITESLDTVKKNIRFRVPQGKVLGLLLLLLYVNDLPNSSNLLVPIMFADDTSLFSEHSNINTLFKIVNDELIEIEVFIVPWIRQKVQHSVSSTKVENKQSRDPKSQCDEISWRLNRWEFITERTHRISWK